MNTEVMIKVTEIQRFCMHDGPGLRTTVFLKGCPLRCAWCHNPETQRRESELLLHAKRCIGCGSCAEVCSVGAHTMGTEHVIDREKCVRCGRCALACPSAAIETCGQELSVEQILERVERDRAFYGGQGGVTLSGGEPFAQGRAVLELLRACRERGLSTAVESCGYADPDVLRAAVPLVDLFLFDLKDTDDERHRRYTGVSNRPILEHLRCIDQAGGRIRLRCILVNGVNTDEAHYRALADVACGLTNLEGVELMAYHAYGGSKATLLGQADNGRREWIPTEEQMARARAVIQERGVRVW